MRARAAARCARSTKHVCAGLGGRTADDTASSPWSRFPIWTAERCSGFVRRITFPVEALRRVYAASYNRENGSFYKNALARFPIYGRINKKPKSLSKRLRRSTVNGISLAVYVNAFRRRGM